MTKTRTTSGHPICQRDHSGEIPRAIENLDRSQRGFWRQRCAGCAYLLGRADAAASEERLRARVRVLEQKIAELEKRGSGHDS